MAMKQAVPPQGQARNDFDICADIADALGVRDTFTGQRDANAWLRHLYDRWRTNCAKLGVAVPDFATFWAEGSVEIPVPEGVVRALREVRRRSGGAAAEHADRADRAVSATIDSFGYADCPGHPVWIAPREYLGSPRAASYPLHLLTVQPATRLHSQWDHVGVSRDSKIAGREPLTRMPTMRRSAASPMASGAGVQRPRRVPRRRAVDARHAARRRGAGDRRLAGQPRRRPVRARQSERADAGCRHVAPRAGAGGAELPGRGGTLHRRPATGACAPTAADRGRGIAVPRAILLDLDGTLIDSRPGIAASCEAALRALGHTPDPSFDVTPLIGPPLPQVISRLLERYGDDRVDAGIAAYRAHYGEVGLHQAAVYPEIVDALRLLSARATCCVVTSSKWWCCCRLSFAYCLKLRVQLMHRFAARTFGNIPLLLGGLEFVGQALAHRLGARFGFARMIFHAGKDFGGLMHEVERGGAVVPWRRRAEAQDVFVRARLPACVYSPTYPRGAAGLDETPFARDLLRNSWAKKYREHGKGPVNQRGLGA